MKFTAEKNDLITALGRCVSVTDAKSPQPILANVKIVTASGMLSLSATDLTRAASAKLTVTTDEAGALCLPARELLERVKLLPDGRVAVSVEGTKATIKTIGSTRRFVMHGIPAAEFPSIPEPTGWDSSLQTTGKQLAEIIGAVCHAISSEASRAHLNGMLLTSDGSALRAVATDGHRLCTIAHGQEPGATAARWLIPLAAITDLRRLLDTKSAETFTIREARGTLFFELPGLTFSTRLVDQQFPPWEQIVPKNSERQVTIDREALADALRAVSVSSSSKTGGVKFTFRTGALLLEAESHDTGEGFDEIATDYDGAEISIGFNARYVLDALSVLVTDQITLSTSAELDPAAIRAVGSDSFLAIVMPMRI